jgi:hypothetical protein
VAILADSSHVEKYLNNVLDWILLRLHNWSTLNRRPSMKQPHYVSSPNYRKGEPSLAYKLVLGCAATIIILATIFGAVLAN